MTDMCTCGYGPDHSDQERVGSREESQPETWCRARLLGQVKVAYHNLFNPPAGWWTFGTHMDSGVDLEFWGVDDDGLPIWERVK